jgi:hypothetical protein
MDAETQTAELASRGIFLLAPMPPTLEAEGVRQQEQTSVVSRERREAALREAKDIARAEMARRSRRLGELTREQEIGLENLLMSTVTRVLELTGKILESQPMVP